jgi:acyl carrier protein
VAKLVEEVCPQVRMSAADHDKPLKDLGVDSLDMAGIFLAISEKLGLRVPDGQMDSLDTVRRIAAYLDGNRSSAE